MISLESADRRSVGALPPILTVNRVGARSMADELLRSLRAEIKRNAGRYYVYILRKPDGTPFYVGCGRAVGGKAKPRILDHERLARYGQKSLKSDIIRKIWKAGEIVAREIDSWHDGSDEMFVREISLISFYGRRDKGLGPLANGNDGGTGQLNPSTSIRELMSVSHKRRWTPEERERQRQRVFAQHRKDPELRKRIGETQVDRWTAEERERQAERSKAGINRPDVRLMIVENMKKHFADPAIRQAHADAAKLRGADPDRKQKWSEAQRRNWQDPEYRERMLKSFRSRRGRIATQ